MKVELHLHTSRYSGCAMNSPEEMMSALTAARYGAVFITEHDSLWPQRDLARLQEQFPDILIFPGIERGVSPGPGHLLILGATDEEYLRLDHPSELIAKARSQGLLTVLAHPFRWEGGAGALQGDMLPDAIEQFTSNQSGDASRKSQEAAKRLHLPLVNAGDSHSVGMIGRFWIASQQPVRQATDIREIVRSGMYVNCVKEEE